MMTKRTFKMMMNKLPAGEYRLDADGMWNIYQMICPKSYKDTSKIDNRMRYHAFVIMFDEHKYGFECMFNGDIHYVGTNDLSFLVVK